MKTDSRFTTRMARQTRTSRDRSSLSSTTHAKCLKELSEATDSWTFSSTISWNPISCFHSKEECRWPRTIRPLMASSFLMDRKRSNSMPKESLWKTQSWKEMINFSFKNISSVSKKLKSNCAKKLKSNWNRNFLSIYQLFWSVSKSGIIKKEFVIPTQSFFRRRLDQMGKYLQLLLCIQSIYFVVVQFL